MRDLRANRRGNVAIIVAASAFAIAAGTGLAMNASRMQTTGDELQRVADAAALGAVVAGQNKDKSDEAVAAAGLSLANSMLVDSAGSPAVSVDVEDRDPTRVSVTITQAVPMIFGELLARPESQMERRATAISQAAEPVCLLVLNRTEPETLRLQGSPQINTRACSVHVNSKAAQAVKVGGSASIDASSISIAGPPGRDGKMEPKPEYNQPQLKDPMADKIGWPNVAGCSAANTGYVAKKNSAAPAPGNYCGGMTFASQADVTLTPGTYVIQTGGLSFGANAKVRGPGGVTFVLLDPRGRVDMQGGPDIDLQAPTSGPWAGVVLAVKPQPTRVSSTLNGGGSLVLGGVVYMPTQNLEFHGGSSLGGLPMSRGFVVDTLTMQGSGELTLAGDESLQGAQRNPRLMN